MIKMINKKSQGLSLSVMAIAALILVVILVVMSIFGSTLGNITPFFKEQTTCTARGGECGSFECTIDDEDRSPILGLGCSGDRQYCCIKETG